MTWSRKVPLLMAGMVSLAATPLVSKADPYTLGNLSTFAIYGYGTSFTSLDRPGPLYVDGNIGIGAGGVESMGGTGITVAGMLYFADPVSASNFLVDGSTKATINGQPVCSSLAACNTASRVVGNSAVASGARTDMQNLYSSVYAHAPSQTLSGIASSTTVHASASTLPA